MELGAWIILAAAVFALASIIIIPRNAIPDSRSSKYQDVVKVAIDRNSIRATTAQVVAGLAFVATFIQSSNNFTRDYTLHAELGIAEQFSKAIAQIQEKPESTWSTIGSFQILANIARSSPDYHEAVYGSLAQFILQVGDSQCQSKAGLRDYRPPPALRSALPIMRDRNIANDPRLRKFDLARACLVRGDFLSSGGLSKLYMPGARLAGADVRFSEVTDSDWGEVQASVEDFAGWEEKSGWSLITSGTDRYNWIANFEGTKFKNVVFEGAKLKGANFKDAKFTSLSFIGADLSKTDLRNAEFRNVNLSWTTLNDANIAGAVFDQSTFNKSTFEQPTFDQSTRLVIDELMTACIRVEQVDGRPAQKLTPTLPAALEAEVQKRGGFRLCQ